MRAFLRRHGQTLVNLFVFVCLGLYAVERARHAFMLARRYGEFDFVAVAFFLHNVVLVTLVLVRRRHQDMDRNAFHQAVAMVAFFSGLALVETPGAYPAMLRAAQVVTLAAIALGTVALIDLGRSFGILIAVREVKTGGLYAVVRHPMYMTDILWRVGFTLQNLCRLNVAVCLVSSACYVYRALLEERFLRRFPQYRQYAERVRYRFVPGVF